MIIPTLRITDKETYKYAVNAFLTENVKLLRVNMTRQSLDKYCEDVEYIKKLSDNQIDIMADIPLPGRKYRLNLAQEREILIDRGQEVVFTSEKNENMEGIPVNINFFADSKTGDKIIIGDGEISFSIKEANQEKIIAVADNTGTIRGKRAFVSVGASPFEVFNNTFLQTYLDSLQIIKPSKVVLSFAEQIDNLLYLQDVITAKLPEVQIIPKIETQRGVDNFEEIAEHFSEIMLGRGDLALYSALKDFGKNQNYILECAKQKKVNIIAATDILVSLYSSIIPARGELTDIYYLSSKGVKDIVVSAGISMNVDLFERFCDLTKQNFGGVDNDE